MKVLIAVDDSDASTAAVAAAKRLFPAAEMLVVSIVDTTAPVVIDPLGLVPSATAAVDRLGMSRDAAERAAHDAADELGDASVVLRDGDPLDDICDIAAQHGVDVIVVGQQHHGLVRRLLDPPLSEGVLRRSRRPVLVVPV